MGSKKNKKGVAINVSDEIKDTATETILGSPYEVRIKNASDNVQLVRLWDNNSRKKKVNHKYVHIYTTFPLETITYENLLAQIEHKNTEIGMLYLQNVIGPGFNKQQFKIRITHFSSDGGYATKCEHIHLNPMQQQVDVLEWTKLLKLDKNTVWELEMQPNTCLQLSAYPIMRLQRAFSN